MALHYVNLAFLTLYLFSRDAMANHFIDEGCPMTPWSDVCRTRCTTLVPNIVYHGDCQIKVLPAGSYEEMPPMNEIDFINIENISTNAFRGYGSESVFIKTAIRTIENEAFNEMSVSNLVIKDNPNLVALPPRTFRGVIGLVLLRFINNGLKSLPREIFQGLDNLTQLMIVEASLACLAYDIFWPVQKIDELIFRYEGYEEFEVQGLCAQSFRNMSAKLEYSYELDKCAIDCSEGMVYSNFTNATKRCDCSSIDGCLGSCCKAITFNGSPGSNPGIGHLGAFVTSAILWILTRFQG